jgi:hypothetical protein
MGRVTPRMTSRGALAALAALFLAGNLLAAWLGAGVLPGLAFALGCPLAVAGVARRDLLLILAAPLVLFLAAVLVAQAVTAPGSGVTASAEAVAEGTFLTLAGTAPWLFGGLAAALAVAVYRGLPACLGELRADLRAERDARRQEAAGY